MRQKNNTFVRDFRFSIPFSISLFLIIGRYSRFALNPPRNCGSEWTLNRYHIANNKSMAYTEKKLSKNFSHVCNFSFVFHARNAIPFGYCRKRVIKHRIRWHAKSFNGMWLFRHCLESSFWALLELTVNYAFCAAPLVRKWTFFRVSMTHCQPDTQITNGIHSHRISLCECVFELSRCYSSVHIHCQPTNCAT